MAVLPVVALGHFVFSSQLFKFPHDTICDTWNALGQQAVTHGSDDVQFFADRPVYKVCVDKNMVWRS